MRRVSLALHTRCTARFVCGLAAPTHVALAAAATPPNCTATSASTTDTAAAAAVAPGSAAKPDPFDPDSIAAEFKMDAKAAEQMRVAQAIGEEAFEENTAILQKLAMRGLRAFVIAAVGLGAFGIMRKRKKKQDEKDEANSGEGNTEGAEAILGQADKATPATPAADRDDPTQRYLEEMRGLGFDVDTLEEELATEKASEDAKKKNAKAHRSIA